MKKNPFHFGKNSRTVLLIFGFLAISVFSLTIPYGVSAQEAVEGAPQSSPEQAQNKKVGGIPESFNVRKFLDLDFDIQVCEENPESEECKSESTDGPLQGQKYFDEAKERGISPAVQVILNAIDLLVKLIGSVALLIFIAGALLTIVSEGQEDRLQKGKQAMIYSLIGIVIALASYVIVTFVQSFFY